MGKGGATASQSDYMRTLASSATVSFSESNPPLGDRVYAPKQFTDLLICEVWVTFYAELEYQI